MRTRMASFETNLKAAYDRWQSAEGTPDEQPAEDAYAKLVEEADDDACICDGEIWYEHDYDEYECRRCGAEADPMLDEEES